MSMEFSRQEYCSGLPFPSPGDLPQPEIKPVSLVSPELADDSLPIEPLGKPPYIEWHLFIFYSNILLAFANLISPRYMVCSMKSGPVLRNTRGWSPTAKAPQTSHQVPLVHWVGVPHCCPLVVARKDAYKGTWATNWLKLEWNTVSETRTGWVLWHQTQQPLEEVTLKSQQWLTPGCSELKNWQWACLFLFMCLLFGRCPSQSCSHWQMGSSHLVWGRPCFIRGARPLARPVAPLGRDSLMGTWLSHVRKYTPGAVHADGQWGIHPLSLLPQSRRQQSMHFSQGPSDHGCGSPLS